MITALSWNIWGGRHLDQVAEFLAASNADVIGLQEVRELRVGDIGTNQAATLADRLGYEYTYCPAHLFKTRRGTFSQGNALLTRLPIKSRACHILSEEHLYLAKKSPATEPRVALEAMIQAPSGDLRVLVTHLAFSLGFRPSPVRDTQIAKLLPLLGPRTILMGDFNILPTAAEIQNLGNIMLNVDPLGTAPTWRPFAWKDRGFLSKRLDHIFVSRELRTTSFAIGSSPASDHSPIWTTVEA